jgi:hypothetical protein
MTHRGRGVDTKINHLIPGAWTLMIIYLQTMPIVRLAQL